MSASDNAEQADRSRVRSPNFPVLSLGDALEKIAVIYDNDKRSATSPSVILSHLGLGDHGGSRRTLSALRQYGLLEERAGGLFRVSDLGFKLLHSSEHSDEHRALLKEAANNVHLFQEILKFYHGDLPSDQTLISHLVLNKSFNPAGAGQFIKVLRSTITLANISPEDYNLSEMGPDEGMLMQTKGSGPTKGLHGDALAASSSGVRMVSIPVGTVGYSGYSGPTGPTGYVGYSGQSGLVLPLRDNESEVIFKIAPETEARIRFNGDVTQEAIEKLIAYLGLSKDAYPTAAMLQSIPLNDDSEE